jgi:putative drug exporter of the RND superfamily
MFSKIGNFAVKFKFWIIGAWAAAAVLMFLFAPSLSEVGTMKESDFLPRDSESLQASELMAKYFPEASAASSASLVFYNPQKLSDADLAYARQTGEWLSSGQPTFKVASVTSVFTNPELQSSLISPDRTTMLLSVGMGQAAFDAKSTATTREIRTYLKSAPGGLKVYVSGQVGIYGDMFDALNKSMSLTTLVTVLLVIILLIIIYRSPVAVLVPLVTIVIAFLVSRGTVGLIGKAGVSIWSQLDVFLIVMVFGIGTDYCLFLISRFREELGRHDSRTEAMKATVSKIGAVITASAFAVIVGLSGMYVAKYQMIKTMGPMMGLAIFITLLAALTLAPALASVFGRKLFWPRHEETRNGKTGKQSRFWEKLAGISTGKPIIVAGVLIILMLLPYLAMPKLNRSFDQLTELPQDAESIAGYNILEQHFDIGEMDPAKAIILVPEGKKITDPDALAALSKITTALSKVAGVVKVQSAVQPEGNGQTPAALTVSGQLITIGSGITASFSGASANMSALFSPELGATFTMLSSYLGELSQNFTWVKSEASYQALFTDLKGINQTVETIKTGALVENQLQMLSMQINNASQQLGKPGATLTPEAIGLFTALKGYLDELASQYPEIKSQAGYQTAYPIISKIGAALVSSQPPNMLPPEVQAVLATLPDSLQQLSIALNKIADNFRGKNAMLFSNSLSFLSSGVSPAETLKSQFISFNTNLQTLSAKFKANGDPVFFSPTLTASSTQLKTLMNMFFSADGRATELYIVLDTYPQAESAMTTVTKARQAFKTSISITALKESEAAIGGTSAVLADVRHTLDRDFNIVMIVVICAIFIVLAILLKSLIAPLYLLATVLLSYGATLGIISWIFQDIMGQAGVSFMIPIILFVLLIALGSDYNIFLMARVREESATRPTREGARLAAIVTGGVITACGIILAGTFATLVITPIQTMVQLGAAVAIGVFIDTFLVRAMLVPAIASLLGKWNWWPSKHG